MAGSEGVNKHLSANSTGSAVFTLILLAAYIYVAAFSSCMNGTIEQYYIRTIILLLYFYVYKKIYTAF